MRLTAFTDYCLRVLIYVATQPQGRSTIADIANAYRISEHHVVKVVHRLGQEGLLSNKRGRGGGLELGRPAAEINVGAVVRMAERRDGPAVCFSEDPAERKSCPLVPACRLAGALKEAMDAFYGVLDRYTVQDLVRNQKGIRTILHPVKRVA